ncbi:MAG: TonB-dependent receptor [Prevotella sp.]|nr:TonB-dependent receptor [Prevotella sp.]
MRIQLTFLLVLCSVLSAAQDSIHHIPEVVVSHRIARREIIAPQRLGSIELERLNAQSIADALRFFSGLQLKDYGGVGGIKTVDIRSMGSGHMGVFYDGIELSNAQNGQIDLGQYSLDNIDEIALYNGQKSAIFQPASDFGNAGSIYIRTHLPQFAPGEHRHLRFNASYGASNTLRSSVLWEQRLSSSIRTSVNAGVVNSDGKYKFRYRRMTPSGDIAYDTTTTRLNGDILSGRLEGNVTGIIDRGYWIAKAYLYGSKRGIPGAIVNNVWRRGERQDDINTFLQVHFQKDVTKRFSTQLLGKYAFYRAHYVNRDTTQLPADNRYWQQEGYLSTVNACDLLPGWSASMAYDLKWNKLNADTYRFPFPTRWSHFLSIATSLDFPHLKMQASLLGTLIKDHQREDGGKSLHRLVPALFVTVPVNETISLRAFAKQSFRMPTFNDLYYTNFGNASLLPERAVQYDMGIVIDKSWGNKGLTAIHLQANGYFNTIHDKIIAYPKGQQFRWTMLNLGRVHITGVDFSSALTMVPARQWQVTGKLQYTYQDARDVTDPSTSYYKDQIPYIPYHSGSAIMSVLHRGFTLNYSFIYVGERYNEQENIPYNHMQPWYTHDLSLQYEWTLGGIRWKATAEVNNVFNQQYDVILNYPMPGRNGRIALQVTL